MINLVLLLTVINFPILRIFEKLGINNFMNSGKISKK